MVKTDFAVQNGLYIISRVFGVRSVIANDINVNNYTNNKAILKLYISARVHHIYGKLNKAKNLYNEIIMSGCSMNQCKASAQFYKRLSN